jgi:hypothetical protein
MPRRPNFLDGTDAARLLDDSRHACACVGLLEGRTILLRRAQQHRHTIEGKAVFCEIKNTAGNFRAFAALTWY